MWLIFFSQKDFQSKHDTNVGIRRLFKQRTPETTKKPKIQRYPGLFKVPQEPGTL